MPDTLSPGTGLPIDPASLGSLANTLTQSGVMSRMQADADAQQKMLDAQVEQARNAASRAGQDYQQALRAPAPDQAPGQGLVPGTMGILASLITGDKGYTDRARSHMEGEKQSLIEHRAENLKALSQVYKEKADAAQKIGNETMREKMLIKKEQTDKTAQMLHDQITERHGKHSEYIDRQRLALDTRKQAFEEGKTTASGDMASSEGGVPEIDSQIRTTRNGNKFMDLTNFASVKAKDQARARASKLGIPLASQRQTDGLNTAEEVYAGLDQAESVLSTILPHQTGDPVKDFVNRKMAGIKNLASALSESNVDTASWPSTLPLAIRSLQAVVAGAGSGFRLTQQEINAIRQRWPRLDDNIETARAKLAWERWFLKNKENSVLRRDWSVEAEPVDPRFPATGLLNKSPTSSKAASAKPAADPLGIR